MPAVDSSSQNAFQGLLQKCVEYARSKGIGDFRLGRRAHPRMPFVHAVRYCLDSMPSQSQSRAGYTLNISAEGMALCCREAVGVDTTVRVRLPLPDGETVWMEGKVVYCEPDEEHYQAGIAFTEQDSHAPHLPLS